MDDCAAYEKLVRHGLEVAMRIIFCKKKEHGDEEDAIQIEPPKKTNEMKVEVRLKK